MRVTRVRIFLFIVALVLVAAGGTYYWWHMAHAVPAVVYQTPQEANVYVRFDMEAYDKITANYWQKVADADLAALYQLSLQKAEGTTTLPVLATKDRTGVAAMLGTAMAEATSTVAEKSLALNVVTIALYNLAPAGRDSLLAQAQEVALRNEVANVNPSTNLYNAIGLATTSSVEAVQSAYAATKAALAASTSPAAKAELQKAAYAAEVLTNTNDKALYDQAHIEPTVFPHIIGHTLYLDISQISPTTLQEFVQAVDTASTTPGLDSMILDLRGNIGGALDFAPAFLGLFIGQNQYAFDFFHQGNYLPQRTTEPEFTELARYRDIALLTDNMTQSTAEIVTAMFKRFNLGHVVGGTTRGWGTVENTTPLTTVIDPSASYALLLVQYITLRDDGQPIEGRGVDPNVNISDKNWQQELPTYFRSQSLISALEQEAPNPPLK